MFCFSKPAYSSVGDEIFRKNVYSSHSTFGFLTILLVYTFFLSNFSPYSSFRIILLLFRKFLIRIAILFSKDHDQHKYSWMCRKYSPSPNNPNIPKLLSPFGILP